MHDLLATDMIGRLRLSGFKGGILEKTRDAGRSKSEQNSAWVACLMQASIDRTRRFETALSDPLIKR